jgi:hypothetical protein
LPFRCSNDPGRWSGRRKERAVKALEHSSPWAGSRDRTCTRCGSPIRIGRGQVDRTRDNKTGELVVRWQWRCGCGRTRTLKRLGVA